MSVFLRGYGSGRRGKDNERDAATLSLRGRCAALRLQRAIMSISPDDRRDEPPKFACDEVVRLPERKARTPKGPQGAERALCGVQICRERLRLTYFALCKLGERLALTVIIGFDIIPTWPRKGSRHSLEEATCCGSCRTSGINAQRRLLRVGGVVESGSPHWWRSSQKYRPPLS